jgi:murein DD-endopeptidase MepM/ murein hydrolase activator NlpD
MRWLLTFLAGILLGAGGLFVYLRQIPHDAPAATVVVAPVATPPAAGTDPLAGSLPPAPVVSTDLTEADLPLRPTQQEIPMPADVAGNAAAATPGKLMIPVEGMKLAQLADNFDQPRGKERHHEALDIMAPKGTKVIAVADGKVVKLFNSKPGGLTVYQFDPTGKYAYYYAHLDRYAEGVKEGSVLKRGDPVGYVGTTGNASADAPHLHFAVVELTPKKEWWKGTPINPYPMMADQEKQ